MIKFILSLLFLTVQTLAITDAERAQLGIGNINYLTNPGFESGRGGWSVSGGTFSTVASSSVQYGKGSVSWDSNAASQTLTSSQVIPLDSNNGLKGQSGLFSCFIKVTSGTATHKLQVYVGTTLFEQSIVSSTDGARTNLYFPISTTSSQNLQLAGIISVASNEPEIIVDDCFLGLASGAGSGIGQFSAISEWQSYTPTFTGFGTVSGVNVRWRRVGGSIEVQGQVVSGTSTATEARMSLPEGMVTASDYPTLQLLGKANYNGNATTDFSGRTVLGEASRTYVMFGREISAANGLSKSDGNAMISSGQALHFNFVVRIQGFSASQSAAAANQTDYGWTDYTPTFTNFGTVTGISCQHMRSSENMWVRCKATSGTVVAGEARVSLPNSLTTTAIASIQGVGVFYPGGTGAAAYYVLIEPSTAYLTFGIQASGSAALTKANGNAVVASSTAFSFLAGPIPISGWVENQRAPTLIGSVTSNSVGAMRLETALLGTTNGDVTESSDWISSCTKSGTNSGINTCTINSGVFSSTPICLVSVGTNASYVADIRDVTATGFVVDSWNPGVSLINSITQVLCMGRR